MGARRGRPAVSVELSGDERETLERWARRPESSQALALRCRIVLAAAQGRANNDVAAELGCHPATVSKWRRRFAQRRLDGLADDPRPGPPRKITDAVIEDVLVRTLETVPADATHWSTRSMAKAAGVTQTAVSQIWRAFGLKPHLIGEYKVSPDPLFVEKVRDVAGLYLNPPDAAVVLCVDEKTGIEALDRTAPILPLMPGTPQRRTHDYRRHRLHRPVRSPRHRLRQSDHLDDPASPKRGVPQIPEPHRHTDPRQPRRAHRVRQRLHPQNPGDPATAGASPQIPPALHPHLQLLDEPRRALVLRTHH